MAKNKRNRRKTNSKVYDVRGKKDKNVENKNKNRNKENKKQMSKAKKIVLWTIVGLLIAIIIAIAVVVGIIFGMFKKYAIPLDNIRISSENTVILDTDGNVIATLNADEKRESIKINEMAKYLPTAFVAIEDERFYDHQGVDIKRTAAATFSYIFKGDSSFGGSTITQQLVKNITKDDERDATRKIKEMARAYNLEKTLTKDDILELYLNMIFMGEDVYGVQMASRLYFNKNASELDLAEVAFLAGINNSPNAYRPFEDSEEMKQKIKTRTLTVINKMHDLGKIETEEEYNLAVEKVNNGLVFTKGNIDENNYSYHTDAVINQVIRDIQKANPDMTDDAAKFFVYNGGLTIYSTQVTSIQTAMEEEYKNTKYLIKSSKSYVKDNEGNDTTQRATTQSAMTIIDYKTGQVVATVGGFGEKTARGLNRSTQQPKQPGSTIKPIAVIAPSLEEGLITAGTVIDDTSMGNWPKNSGGGYTGLMTVRDIIRVSRNIPEVKMINKLGVAKSVEYLRKFGLKHLDERDENPAIALGGLTQGATTLEMAGAYAAIANDGVYIEPTFYTKVVDQDGNTVLEPNQETRTVISADNAYILKSILREPVNSGTAAGMGVKIQGIDTCGKTGTTDINERWFCGFTPYYAAATWYGFDKQEGLSTGNTAATIWGVVMKKVHTGLESKNFEKTGNIVSATICKDSGLLATALCKNAQGGLNRAYSEIFVKGTAPTKSCTTHVIKRVCIAEDGTKRIATDNCPNAQELVFITRPNSDKDTSWRSAADAKYMLPTETCTIHTEPATPSPSPSPSVSPSPQTTPTVTKSPIPTSTTTATAQPSKLPTTIPSVKPSEVPTVIPSKQPTIEPTPQASIQPSVEPNATTT